MMKHVANGNRSGIEEFLGKPIDTRTVEATAYKKLAVKLPSLPVT